MAARPGSWSTAPASRPGGISWYPFFVDTGSAGTTRGNWLAIAQNGGSVALTSDAADDLDRPGGW